MEIICKQCNASYSISTDKLPQRKATAKCKRCGSQIVINEAARERKPSVAPSPPPMPSTAPAPGPDRTMASVFPEISDYNPVHYDLANLLKANKKGNYKTSINKFKVKILSAVKPTLDQMLREDERVLAIAAGIAYYPIEILFGNGFFTMLYNRYALVATNKRLVMINTNHRMTQARHYLFQMAYAHIKKVSRGLFRTSLTLTPKSGKRRTFTSMKKAFAGDLLKLIEPRLDPLKAIAAAGDLQSNICPACYSPLGDKLAQCTECRATFKSPINAALRSLILPGLGDLYLGHRFLGLCEMAGSLVVWLVALSMLLQGGSEGIVIAAILLIFCNGLDFLLTLHMGKKGYLLNKKQPLPEPRSRLATSSV
jgi:predicted Zn finger-like uncharacterized protein